MSNIILACPVIGDKGTITGSQVAAGLPLANLKKSPIGMPARFLTPEGAFITVDLGENPSSVDLLALIGHNASVSGEVRVRAAEEIGGIISDNVFDSGVLRLRSNLVAPDYSDVGSMDRNNFILHMDEPVIARYWRFDIEDTAVDYMDIGRLYVSKAFKPAVNMDYGLQEGFIDPSTMYRTISGRKVPNERPKMRYAEFVLSFGTEDEMFGHAFDIDNAQGMTRDVLFVNDYDKKPLIQKRSIYGNCSALNPVINTQWQIFEKTYRIEEIVE